MPTSIVFVHGLQGHPKQTWSYTRPKATSSTKARSPSPSQQPGKSKLFGFLSRGDKLALSPDGDDPQEDHGKEKSNDRLMVFWPRDVLPKDCKRARILTWGYNTVVTKGYEAANKNNIFAHAKNLLAAIKRERPQERPIIFVAHSLGGILVKEVCFNAVLSELPLFRKPS
jgi:hypothetical protein